MSQTRMLRDWKIETAELIILKILKLSELKIYFKKYERIFKKTKITLISGLANSFKLR